MNILDLKTTDPFFNLAVDEYLLKNSEEEYLVLGVNELCAVTGKHQVSHRETETKFVYEHSIPVIRRISGGGTVIHDPGNLNFSFILNSLEGKQVDFRKYTGPVIDFLGSLGVHADFEGKNDLKVNGLKISGNAEHVHRKRVLHHGTLLFDSDLSILKNSIRKETGKYSTRAVASNPSSVINIKTILQQGYSPVTDISAFRSGMAEWFRNYYLNSETVDLTEKEKESISLLADTKYRTWEWNYAYGPEYTFSNRFDFDGENIFFELEVQNGRITDIRIEGSAFTSALKAKLVGQRHMVDDLKEILMNGNLIDPDFDIFNLF